MPPFRPLLPSFRSRIRFCPPLRLLSHKPNLWYVKVQRSWSRGFSTRILILVVAVAGCTSILESRRGSASSDVGLRDEFTARRDNRDSRVHEEKRSVSGAPHSTRVEAFIPVGWPRKREGDFYTASDPEWKVFAQVKKDEKRLEALKGELASIALGEASQSSLLADLLGSPFKIDQYWLQPYFPPRAPPVYCRSGFLVTNLGVAWTWEQPMPDSGIGRSVPPHSVSLAVKNAYQAIWQTLLDKFSLGQSNNERPTRGLSEILGQSSEAHVNSDLKTLDKLSNTSSPESRLLAPPESHDNASPNHDDRLFRPSAILSTLDWLPLPRYGPGTDLHTISLAFKKGINECRVRDLRAHRRGTFFVRGPVGLKGSSGFCRIEVEGEYDPVASEWLSISMHVRDLDLLNDKPLGDK
ncbi:uncharacterized protein BDV14DRAFT_179613 [Aspergillus stella-maris]|uniref:uncharacterized protein n=1 Tax=Aspergillus stella-maris TaxID=1810926 RepID=UPI003CCE31FB